MWYYFYWLKNFQCQSVSCAHDRDAVQSPLLLVLSPYIDIPGLRKKSGVKLRSPSRILKKRPLKFIRLVESIKPLFLHCHYHKLSAKLLL